MSSEQHYSRADEMDKLLGTLWDATLKIDKLIEPMPTKESDRPSSIIGLVRAQYLAEYLTRQLDKAIDEAIDQGRIVLSRIQ